MKALTASLVCLYILSGCATQATHEYNRINTQLIHTKKVFLSCQNNTMVNTQVYKRLNKILIMDTNKETKRLFKLSIDRNVTEEESKDILEYAELKEECRKPFIDELKKAHQDFAMVIAEAYADSDAKIVKVLQKKITIGESNQQTIDTSHRAKQKWTEVERRVISQLKSSHQTEIAQRQRFNDAVQRWNYQQQLLNTLRTRY